MPDEVRVDYWEKRWHVSIKTFDPDRSSYHYIIIPRYFSSEFEARAHALRLEPQLAEMRTLLREHHL